MSSDKIRVMLIFEIIGKPAEHIVKSLNEIIDNLDEEKGVSVKERDVKPAKEMEKQKDFYSSFAEVEVEVEELMLVAMLMFKYTPAYVSIIEPETIRLNNSELSEVFSELVRRLHGYDEVARVLQMQKLELEKKLKEKE